MPQLFTPQANTHARIIFIGAVLTICGAGWVTSEVFWSPYTTYVDVPFDQPVPFSHKHHVGDDGIDCRYCHNAVEESAFAGMPSSETCMSCHSQIFGDAPMLAPVRQSLVSHVPLQWNRVDDLPDYVYFNHSIHVAKGIGCSSCHGRVDQMPLIRKTQTLYMKWCLECHRDPGKFVRPATEIYNLNWEVPADREQRRVQATSLIADYRIDTTGRLTNCSVCHR